MKVMYKTLIGVLLWIIFVLFCFCVGAYGYEYTPEEIVLIATVAQSEAGNQTELGRRLVIDCILNRVEAEEFPASVSEVILQRGQFTSRRLSPPPEMITWTAEELYFRTNPNVLWFRTKQYSKYGAPIVKEGAHYFSGRY